MYYKYDPNTSIIVEKSETAIEDTHVCISDVDFDIQLYDIYVGSVDSNKVITFHSERPKPTETLISVVKDLRNTQSDMSVQSAEAQLDIDYRLSKIELGLS